MWMITEPTDYFGQVGLNPDPLWPLDNGASIDLNAGENTPLWFTVYIPKTTPSGEYTTTVRIGDVTVPVKLHVFDFTIPDELAHQIADEFFTRDNSQRI